MSAIFANDISRAHLLATDIPNSHFIPRVALLSIAFFNALNFCINPRTFATTRTTTRWLTNHARNFCTFDLSFTCKNGINPTIFVTSSERISFNACSATCAPIECPTRKHAHAFSFCSFFFSSSTLERTYFNTCACCSSNVNHRVPLLVKLPSA